MSYQKVIKLSILLFICGCIAGGATAQKAQPSASSQRSLVDAPVAGFPSDFRQLGNATPAANDRIKDKKGPVVSSGVGDNSPKKLYIPIDWRNPGNNIPWDSTSRCKQSANFAVFWGPLAGTDPVNNTDPSLQFDPQLILDSMERIWNDYINWHLISDSASIAQYKNIIVLNNTWRDDLFTGYAFGGGYDATVGSFWVDKGAFYEGNSFTISHEFTHSCQYIITNILYPGHGFNDVASGYFWETHANFMAWQRNPWLIDGLDPARTLNFTTYNMSSVRKDYANVYYLELLKDKYGLDFINRIWHEANATQQEHPLDVIRRLLGGGQAGVNSFFLEHAMHNVEWDYSTQQYIRPVMKGLQSDPLLSWRAMNILDSLGNDYYAIPDALAPQQYGYNIVRLFVKDSSCAQPYVHLKFKGHVDPNAGSGWLYGFVSVDQNGVSTYSNQYSDSEATYQFPVGAKDFYLVVLGAPTTYHVHKDLFEIGFPKEFRYPWEAHITGMVPEGYESTYNSVTGIAGAPHPNGGGFVAATAQVDATAYIGPHAVVLENARVTGNAKVIDKAIIRQDALVSEDATVSGFAKVSGASVIKGTAKVSGRANVSFTTLSDSSMIGENAIVNYGTISSGAKAVGDMFSWGATLSNGAEYGGDAEIFGPCDKGGRYFQVENLIPQPGAAPRAYCDGNYDNVLNVDTNAVYTYYGEAAMAFGKTVQCGTITGNAGAPPVVNAGTDQTISSFNATASLSGTAISPAGTIVLTQWTQIGGTVQGAVSAGQSLSTEVSNLVPGIYTFKLLAVDNADNGASDTIVISVVKPASSPVVNAGSDKTITLPVNSITLTATATDADNDLQSVIWKQVSGPSSGSVINPNLLICKMDNLSEGIYVFVCLGTDAEGHTGNDTVNVTVLKGTGNTGGTGIITQPYLFPIPASDMVTVMYPATIGGVLSVYDAHGGRVLTQSVPVNTTSVSFSVKHLADGVYFLRIDTYSKDKYKLKLIVAH